MPLLIKEQNEVACTCWRLISCFYCYDTTHSVWLNDLGNSLLFRLNIGLLGRCSSEQSHSRCLKNKGQAESVFKPLLLTCAEVSVFVRHHQQLRFNTSSANKLFSSSSHAHSLQADVLLTRENEMKVFSPTTCSRSVCFLFPQKCSPSVKKETCSSSVWWPKFTALQGSS